MKRKLRDLEDYLDSIQVSVRLCLADNGAVVVSEGCYVDQLIARSEVRKRGWPVHA